jgi:tetratricopeptide (TPR) repeat protein
LNYWKRLKRLRLLGRQRWLGSTHQDLRKAPTPQLPTYKVVTPKTMQGYRDNIPGLSPFTTLVKKAMPLLDDSQRSVRVTAAQVASEIPQSLWKGRQQSAFRRALGELKLGLLVNNDRAATHLTLGNIYENLGDPNLAEQYYRLAIQVEPHATGPRANLAALFERRIESMIASARQNPQSLTPEDRVEMEKYAIEAQQLQTAELDNFKRDAGYAPDNAIVQYRYGLALYRNGLIAEAVIALQHVHQLEPLTPIYMVALARLLQTTGQLEEALKIAEKLIKIEPQHEEFVEELQTQIEQRDQATPKPAPKQ